MIKRSEREKKQKRLQGSLSDGGNINLKYREQEEQVEEASLSMWRWRQIRSKSVLDV